MSKRRRAALRRAHRHRRGCRRLRERLSAGFLQGQGTIAIMAGFCRAAATTSMHACWRTWPPHSRQPIFGVQNMPGDGSLNAGIYLEDNAAKDGTVLKASSISARSARRDLTPRQIRIRSPQLQPYRQHQPGPDRLLRLARARREDAGGAEGVAEGARRLDWRRLLVRSHRAHPEEHFRGEAAACRRLSGQRRAANRDRTRRARRRLRAWSSIRSSGSRGRRSIRCSARPDDRADMPLGVPFAIEIAPNERARQIMQLLLALNQLGRPFIASSVVPAERVRLLCEPFADTMQDPLSSWRRRAAAAALADRGEAARKVVEGIYAILQEIVEAAKVGLQGREAEHCPLHLDITVVPAKRSPRGSVTRSLRQSRTSSSRVALMRRLRRRGQTEA